MDILPLTALERIGPKGYLRYVFPFELAEDYDLDAVASVLRAGYAAAAKKMAVLACEGVPDPAAKQAGVLKMQRIPAGDIEHVAVKDLRESFPLKYSQLKKENFPVSAFDGTTLLRRSVWVQPGERLPASLIQANFIPGGLVLTWCILHMFGDGNTFYTWTRIWAEECRRAQGVQIPDPVVIEPAMLEDRNQVVHPQGHNKGNIEDHNEYTLLPFTPTGAAPKMQSTSHRGQVFYFSPQSLKALKEAASPKYASKPTDQTWISTNDALSALLWRTVMAVQWPLETLEGDPNSVFNIAIDARLRTSPPIHPHTLGCFLAYVAVSAPVRELVSGKQNIADLAAQIRQALTRADGQFTDDVVALVEGLEDVDRLVPTAFLDVPGYHCVQTSWANFELYGLEWGPLLGHSVQSVRAPDVGVINGLQVVLPPLPDGGMEILVGVEASCLDRLLHEPLWAEYAVPR